MKTLLAIIVVSVILALTVAWTFRYHIVVGNDPLTVYSIDRWTGEVSLIAPEPAVRALNSQALKFVRTPLVRLRETSYRGWLTEPLLEEPDPGEPAPEAGDGD